MTTKKTQNVRNGLLAGGNWIIDQVKRINVYPQREQLASILSQHQGTGGAPYNVLVDLAKLGVSFPLFAAGLVGKDKLGDTILEDCRAHGIDTRYLQKTAQVDTSYTDVMTEEGNGRRTFFHYRGANVLWTGDDIDFARTDARLFHMGYLLLLDSLDVSDSEFGTRAARLLASARRAGLKTSVDVVSEDSDRFGRIVLPALKHVDYCILNEIEAGKTTGFQIRQDPGDLHTENLRHAADALIRHGVRELVIIHFPEGGYARTRAGEEVWQSSVRLPAGWIAGTAGAGDAFCAGALLGLHEAWPLKRCLQAAVCAAAMSLRDPTCTAGMQPLEACLALGGQYGYQEPLHPMS